MAFPRPGNPLRDLIKSFANLPSRYYVAHMGRRASSSTSPLWLIAVVIIAAAAVWGGLALKGKVSDPYRTTPVFPVKEYYRDSNALRGNRFKMNGVAGDQLRYTKSGRLFSVEMEDSPVPILVPQELDQVNIRKGQKYLFKVEVIEKGIVRALEVTEA